MVYFTTAKIPHSVTIYSNTPWVYVLQDPHLHKRWAQKIQNVSIFSSCRECSGKFMPLNEENGARKRHTILLVMYEIIKMFTFSATETMVRALLLCLCGE